MWCTNRWFIGLLGVLGPAIAIAAGGCRGDARQSPAASTRAKPPAKPPAKPRPVWLAITRPRFTQALRPLAAWRRAEGLRVVVSTLPPRRAIAALKGARLAYILLVGDDAPGKTDPVWAVPTRWRPLYRWRAPQRKTYASDALWGDLDGDLRPDVPVGRIPARRAADVATVVRKIIAYERRVPGLAQLQLPIWAGAPGYGGVIDSLATTMLIGAARSAAPPWIQQWLISGDAQHALCGWPPDQAEMFTERIARSGVISTLMGHSRAHFFHSMTYRGQRIALTVAQVKTLLARGAPAAPTVIMSCSAGHFTPEQACLAEALIRAPAGPVAAIAATTESHPLTNYHSGIALLGALGSGEVRLGTLWLASQIKAHAARNALIDGMLVNVEGKLDPVMKVHLLRRDQLLMYALFGDPATRLKLPARLEVRRRRHQNMWQWEASKPRGAKRLIVGFRAESVSFAKPPRPATATSARAAHRQANDQFAFQTLAVLQATQKWTGVIGVKRRGVLRLVAEGGPRLHVWTVQVGQEGH